MVTRMLPRAVSIVLMMVMVGLNLARYALALRKKDLAPALVTVGISLLTNMALGFVAGAIVYFGLKYYFRMTGKCSADSPLLDLTPNSKL